MKPQNWMIKEQEDIYHSKSSDFLSSHQLADFRKCPLLYFKKRIGLIQDKDSAAYAFGRAAHTLILEGKDVFDARYAVGGPVNPRTEKPFGSTTRAYADWIEASGKSAAVTYDELITLEMMLGSVVTHPTAPRLITGGMAEVVVRTDYCGIPSQIRCDYYQPVHGLVDLKTCDDLTWFESDARRYGYLHQMAFYRSILRQATGKDHQVHIIAIEKKQPFRAGVWKISSESLDFAQAENESAILRLKECIKTNIFPTGYEDVRMYENV